MLTVIVGIIALLVGGYGGYEYGREAEAKAQAVANALKQSAAVVKKAL